MQRKINEIEKASTVVEESIEELSRKQEIYDQLLEQIRRGHHCVRPVTKSLKRKRQLSTTTTKFKSRLRRHEAKGEDDKNSQEADSVTREDSLTEENILQTIERYQNRIGYPGSARL